MTLNPQDIKHAATALKTVESIDDTITWLGKDAPDKVSEHGKKVRDIFGQNRLRHFTDSHLGEIALCAVINALLEKRSQAVQSVKGIVEIPDAPCPRQTVQDQD